MLGSEHVQNLLDAHRIDHPELDLDGAISFLHVQGASKIESIFAISRVFNIYFPLLKEKVYAHPAWEYRRAADDAFHEQLVAAIDEIAQEDGVAEDQDAQ